MDQKNQLDLNYYYKLLIKKIHKKYISYPKLIKNLTIPEKIIFL